MSVRLVPLLRLFGSNSTRRFPLGAGRERQDAPTSSTTSGSKDGTPGSPGVVVALREVRSTSHTPNKSPKHRSSLVVPTSWRLTLPVPKEQDTMSSRETHRTRGPTGNGTTSTYHLEPGPYSPSPSSTHVSTCSRGPSDPGILRHLKLPPESLHLVLPTGEHSNRGHREQNRGRSGVGTENKR